MKARLLYLAVLATIALVWTGTRARAGDFTPVTYTVNSTLDTASSASCTGDAGCTLRRAIEVSNGHPGADIIVFNLPSESTIMLSDDLSTIADDLTITGPGSPLLTISTDGDPALAMSAGAKAAKPKGATIRKVFRVSGDGPVTVSISGLTVTNAVSNTDGAALYADDDDVTLDDMIFVDNFFVYDSEFGGGAVRVSQGNLTISNSLFMGNYSEGAGGAVICGGVLTITDTDFVENHANSNQGGAVYAYGEPPASFSMTGGMIVRNYSDAQGGGIYLSYSGGTAMLSGVLVASNEGNNGGGIYYGASSGNSLTIEGSMLEHNYSGSTGGGLFFTSSGGSLTITNSTISNNEADSTAGGIYVYTGTGGGVSIIGSGFDENVAGSGGGGIYSGTTGTLEIANSSITNNESGGNGGGLYSDEIGEDSMILNTTVSGNEAAANGGGIYTTNSTNTLAIIHSTITGNTASAGGSSDGGGILIGTSSGVTITNTIIAGNTDIELIVSMDAKGSGGEFNDCSGTVTSAGVNLIGDSEGCTGLSENDLVGVDAMLSDLEDVPESPLAVHVPMMGSPAIGAADSDECAETDTLGQMRVASLCDIGAIQTNALLFFLLSQDDGGCTMSAAGKGSASLALLLLALAGTFAFERRRRRG